MQEMWEIQVWSLGQEDHLEEGLATYSSILAWRTPWTEETGWLQPLGLQRVEHNWSDLAAAQHIMLLEAGEKWKWMCQSLTHVQLFASPWTVAR